MKLTFCNHQESDSAEICRLFTSVFTQSENEAEGKLIGALCQDLLKQTEKGELFVFLAKDNEEQIHAGAFVTRLPSEKEREIYLLAPVAVRTESQAQGVGQSLIRHAIEQLKAQQAQVFVTYGDPNFYTKLGFAPVSESLITPPFPLSQPEGWLAQSLTAKQLPSTLGKCSCAPAFNHPEYW